MSESPDQGSVAAAPTLATVTLPSSGDAYAWGLLALLGSGMALLGFHEIPKEQLTPFVAVLSGVIGGGVGTFIGWKWGTSQQARKEASGEGAPR